MSVKYVLIGVVFPTGENAVLSIVKQSLHYQIISRIFSGLVAQQILFQYFESFFIVQDNSLRINFVTKKELVMRSTFKIAFYVNKSKEKNGLVPVLGRITINGSIAQFSCKQSIAHELWDAKSNRATGRSDQALKVNRTLDNIRAQITKHYQRISDREAYVNAEMVRNAWQGIGMECDTLLGAFDRHNAGFEKRAGKDRSQSTLYKYLSVRRHLADFIKSGYNRSDLHLKEITEDFIRDFGISAFTCISDWGCLLQRYGCTAFL